MASIGEYKRSTVKGLEFISRWTGYISAIVLLIGYGLNFFEITRNFFSSWVVEHTLFIWRVLITASIIALVIWFKFLHNQFFVGLKDKFSDCLTENWDYKGPWKILNGNSLIIKGLVSRNVYERDGIGLTKKGTFWTNYELSFSAHIIHDCIGVIIRAQDMDNFYMVQIRKDSIIPHRRIGIPDFVKVEETDQDGNGDKFRIDKFKVGWQVFEDFKKKIEPTLEDWFSVKIKVHGEAIEVRINDVLILQEDAFLKISSGKIGFRNHYNEEAEVKHLKVKLI